MSPVESKQEKKVLRTFYKYMDSGHYCSSIVKCSIVNDIDRKNAEVNAVGHLNTLPLLTEVVPGSSELFEK